MKKEKTLAEELKEMAEHIPPLPAGETFVAGVYKTRQTKKVD